MDRSIYLLPFASYIKDIMDRSIYPLPLDPSVKEYCGLINIVVRLILWRGRYIYYHLLHSQKFKLLLHLERTRIEGPMQG